MTSLGVKNKLAGSITGNYSAVHTIILTEDEKYEDLLLPETWANYTYRGILSMHDEIIVYPHDNSFRAHLVVLAVGNGWAKVRELLKFSFDENVKSAEAVPLGKYDIRAQGRAGWSIIRVSDGAVIENNLGSRANAEKTLAEFIANNEPAQSV